jgi:predicted transcriptional regulator
MHRVITTIVVYYLKGGITMKSLSKAEWIIMKALWDKPNQPISGIIQTIGDTIDSDWQT